GAGAITRFARYGKGPCGELDEAADALSFIAKPGLQCPSHPRRLRRARHADQCASTGVEFPEAAVRGACARSATVTREAALEGYFAEAAAWDADRLAQARRTTRLALSVAGAGWVAV